MKVACDSTASDLFIVERWWSRTPAYVLESISEQLTAASAVWPELAGYHITRKRSPKAEIGQQGGVARAAKLTPERRREIASIAANARHHPEQEKTNDRTE